MQAMELFLDGFRTDRTPDRQVFPGALQRRSLLEFRLHPGASAYCAPSPFCECPIPGAQAVWFAFSFKFKARDLRSELATEEMR